MIPENIKAEIMHRLSETERNENVRIVLAVESGSRAWGFASPNSDFDVRFIYAKPKDWYVAVDLEEKRDVVEYKITDDIDLNGWDIRKALKLFWKSNPAFIEWIQSPIIYQESGCFARSARDLLSSIYSCDKGIYHYRSMAKTNYRGYLCADMVPLKKYFYVLRPLLAVRWLETYASAPPIEFEHLLHLLDGQNNLLEEINILLEKKKGVAEMTLAPPIPLLNSFIESELNRLESFSPKEDSPYENIKFGQLNELFHAVLNE